MDRCQVYKHNLNSNCIHDELKQQFKQDILHEVKLFLDALNDDVVNVNVKTNDNIKQSYNFMIS